MPEQATVVLETPEECAPLHGLEYDYEVARERHRQLLAEAETYRLQRRIGRRATRRRVVKRTAIGGVCLATAIVLILAATQGQW